MINYTVVNYLIYTERSENSGIYMYLTKEIHFSRNLGPELRNICCMFPWQINKTKFRINNCKRWVNIVLSLELVPIKIRLKYRALRELSDFCFQKILEDAKIYRN